MRLPNLATFESLYGMQLYPAPKNAKVDWQRASSQYATASVPSLSCAVMSIQFVDGTIRSPEFEYLHAHKTDPDVIALAEAVGLPVAEFMWPTQCGSPALMHICLPLMQAAKFTPENIELLFGPTARTCENLDATNPMSPLWQLQMASMMGAPASSPIEMMLGMQGPQPSIDEAKLCMSRIEVCSIEAFCNRSLTLTP